VSAAAARGLEITPAAAKCLTMAAFCALAVERGLLAFATGPRQKAFVCHTAVQSP
jgi:hypothetical protein